MREGNQPVSQDKAPKAEPADASKKIAVNPDPRANENISEEEAAETTTGAGSEITDGEAG